MAGRPGQDGTLEMTTKLSPDVFRTRRERFLDALGDGVAVLPAAPVRLRSNDSDHRYRADNDVLYLTDFAEPECVAVFAPKHPEHQFVLFVRPRDPEREVWDGRRAGVEGAVAEFGADAAFPIEELDAKLPEYVDKCERLAYRLGRDEAFDRRVIELLMSYHTTRRAKGPGPHTIFDPGEIVHEMRLHKSPDELAIMRHAASSSAEAHRAAMAAAMPGMHEYELEALLEYTFRRLGGNGPAYPSIVGSGANATILHYIENSRRIEDGDLVLVDAGGEFGYYASDITRTWPASGRFSAEQRAIYEIVLEAQLEAIAKVRPGITQHEIHEGVVRTMTSGLVQLGLLEGPVDEAIEKGTYRTFYMHKTGHYLGMDVHDVGKYKTGDEWRPLEEGMVVTIEPGLYIAADCESVAPQWRGIGVRIEDDVLVTADGHEVLSDAAPKHVADLERIVGSAARESVTAGA